MIIICCFDRKRYEKGWESVFIWWIVMVSRFMVEVCRVIIVIIVKVFINVRFVLLRFRIVYIYIGCEIV